jgi:hypothetical protein
MGFHLSPRNMLRDLLLLSFTIYTSALTIKSSSFHGESVKLLHNPVVLPSFSGPRSHLTMRKQKASDRRTRRRQQGLVDEVSFVKTLTESPMQARGAWNQKVNLSSPVPTSKATGGRGRSLKRQRLYHSLAFYHNQFLGLLTEEYKAEVRTRWCILVGVLGCEILYKSMIESLQRGVLWDL